MSISVVKGEKLYHVLSDLSRIVDFTKELPCNLFSNEFDYWFFERPLLAFLELFSILVSGSYLCFNSNVLVKFSGREIIDGSCFIFDGKNLDKGVKIISSGFDDFFGGKVGYPILLFNEYYDWVAFESLYEELGVIGVRKGTSGNLFTSLLNDNFISCAALGELAQGSSAESKMARALQHSYCCVCPGQPSK